MDIWLYAGMFGTAFLAATLLPAQSEVMLGSLVIAGYSPWTLLVTASFGNILGSTVNWWIGRGIASLEPSNGGATLSRARSIYAQYGRWSLLLSWVPLVGDPLTLVAGVMREPLASFLILVALAKIGRYMAVIAMTQSAVL